MNGKIHFTIVLLTGSVLLGGCGSGNNVPTAIKQGASIQNQSNEVNNDQQGYIYSGNGLTMFLQMTEADKQLSGQLQIVSANGGNRPNIQNSSHSFKGIHNGSDISIKFDGSVWTDSLGGVTWTGTIKDDELSLVIPDKNTGALNTYIFKKGSVSDFNNIVGEFTQQVNNMAQQNMQAQQRQEAAKQAQDQANNAIHSLNSSVSTIKSSTRYLASETKFGVLNEYADHWKKMQQDNQKMRSDANANPLTGMQLAQVQSDLAQLQSDLAAIQSDHAGLESIKTGLNNDVSQLQTYIDDTQKSWQAVTSLGLTTQYSSNDIETLLSNAKNQITASNQALQNAQGQAASYENQANDLVNSAQKFVDGLHATY